MHRSDVSQAAHPSDRPAERPQPFLIKNGQRTMGSKGRSQLMNQEMDVEVDGDWGFGCRWGSWDVDGDIWMGLGG